MWRQRGALVYSTVSLEVNDTVIKSGINNSNYGGAIQFSSNGLLNILNSEISGNSSAWGAVFISGIDEDNLATVNISDNTVISNNSSSDVGAGIRISYANTVLEGVIIENNVCNNSGCGIFISGDNSVLDLYDVQIINNENNGSHAGAGITIYNGDSIVNLYSGAIDNNICSNDCNYGVGVRVNGGTFIMNGGTISNNFGSKYGAGVGISASASMNATFTMNGGTISNNTATSSDGGIYKNNSYSIYIYNDGTVCGNSPTNSYDASETCSTS